MWFMRYARRQAGRQADRQTDRQTDRQRHIECNTSYLYGGQSNKLSVLHQPAYSILYITQ